MERPVYAVKVGYTLPQDKAEYIQFIRRLEEYCNYLEERNKVLRKRDNVLRALENGGVDNWEWYGESLDVLDEDDEFKD